jgi:hypothetical protein
MRKLSVFKMKWNDIWRILGRAMVALAVLLSSLPTLPAEQTNSKAGLLLNQTDLDLRPGTHADPVADLSLAALNMLFRPVSLGEPSSPI